MLAIYSTRSRSLRFVIALLLLAATKMVNAQNAPIARADTFYVCPGDTHVLYPLANDNDPNGDSIFLSNFVEPLPVINPASGSYTRRGDSVIFVAVQNFSSSVTGAYRVCNSNGQCTFSTYTLVLDAVCNGIKQNRAPIASPDIVFALEDVAIVVKAADNDRDPDGDPLTWEPITQPLNGTLTKSVNNYSYKGNPNYNGFDFFLYRVCDTSNKCAMSVVTIIIAPMNDQPVAYNDTFTILEDQTLVGNVLLNDYDADGDKLKTRVTQNPFNGTVQMDSTGKFVYQPTTNYYGRDEFKYRACDTARFFNCSQARVLINILPVNDAPEIDNVTINVESSGGEYNADVAVGTSDVEHDTLRYHIVSKPNSKLLTATIDSVSGLLQVTVGRGFCGTDSFTIEACDYELCTPATVWIKGANCINEIELVEGFSPNGDGINDQLFFKELDQFAPAYLVVFNRNGFPVYENEDYRNNWSGTNQVNNQPLPDGTYYYVLELSKLEKRYKNYLVIHR